MPASDTGTVKVCGFKSRSVHHLAQVAQLAERQIVALVVVGSSPTLRPMEP